MDAAQIAPDQRSFAKAARTFWFAQQPEEAAALERRMRAAGMEPDGRFYRVTIQAAQTSGMLDHADRLHREAAALGIALGELASERRR